jgi:1,2-diacylglycerol 3-alpha-glucosyltransferase
MIIAVLFDSFGPYHLGRVAGCRGKCEVLGIAGGCNSAEYAWVHESPERVGVKVVNSGGPGGGLARTEFRRRLRDVLDDAMPDVVAVPGWADRLALEAMRWALERGKAVVMMSETSGLDRPSGGWKGWVRRRVIGLCGSALVGGTPHRKYICDQGMREDAVFLGYDAVGNGYYEEESSRWRREDPVFESYFLASNRFIEKKNLSRLLEAQAGYAAEAGKGGGSGWPLVLLGDGELKGELVAHAERLGLTVVPGAPWESDGSGAGARTVYFPGFRQIGELPRFYAHAGAFVHASTKEQWGLVVNEAMACGLPVVVSERCGCAPDLVVNGETGFMPLTRWMWMGSEGIAREGGGHV